MNPWNQFLSDGRDLDFFHELLKRASPDEHPFIRGAWLVQRQGRMNRELLQGLLDLAYRHGVLSVTVMLKPVDQARA